MRFNIKLVPFFAVIIFVSTLLSGCDEFLKSELIVNRYTDVLLTKNNNLQFRFQVNGKLIKGGQSYKVRITIHDDKLAAAIGKREIVYGEDQVLKGEYLETKGNSQKYIFMNPIPMRKDLDIYELENMIERDHAVSIEVFNDEEVLGRTFLENFSSEL